MRTHGIMFHHFHDGNMYKKSQGSISKKELETLLEFYKSEYKVIHAIEYYDKAKRGMLLDNEVCLTFDDTLKCQYDIAYPVINNLGITAFFFIYTAPIVGIYEKLEIYRDFRFTKFSDIEDFYKAFFLMASENQAELSCDISGKLKSFDPDGYAKEYSFYTKNDKRFRYLRDLILGKEKYNALMDLMLEKYNYNIKEHINNLWLSRENIKKLYADGNIIGLHSHTHNTILGNFNYNVQFKEYEENKSILEEIIQEHVSTISYPCNSYNGQTLQILKKLGVKIGFRANMQEGYSGLLEIPREDHTNIIRRIV